jgi:hypothetical protein
MPLGSDERDPWSAIASVVLSKIGVTGLPPSPDTSFAELGQADLNLAWLSGAVHPLTLRGLVGIALAWLPKDAAREVAELFQLAAQRDVESEPPKQSQLCASPN